MFQKTAAITLLAFGVSSAVYAQQQTRTMRVPLPATETRQIFIYDGGSYLGVQTQEVTKENFGKFGLREVRGAAVEKVSENSPAARAGLQNGDVIVKFNGEEIESVRKLTRLIAETAPDHQAKLTISRGGSEREITVTLEKRAMPEMREGAFNGVFGASEIPAMPSLPMPPNGRLIPFPPSAEGAPNVFTFRRNSRQIGISTTTLSGQLKDYFGAADGGVLIGTVRENSPAAKAGLKAGDVIVEVDGKKVDDTADLSRAFGEKSEGEFALTIIRDKNRQTVRVTPETVKSENVEIERFFENAPPVKPQTPIAPAPPDTNKK